MITPDEQVIAGIKNEIRKLKEFGASPALTKGWMKIHKETLRLKYNMTDYEDELFGDDE